MKKVSYSRLKDATPDDREIVQAHYKNYRKSAVNKIIRLLFELKAPEEEYGWKIDRFEHSLQTATRAKEDGADEEMIVVALFHDIGEAVSPDNHCAVGAEILRPFISDESYWIVKNHGIFQAYYYYHLEGKDRHIRDQFKDHPLYQRTIDFCHNWDQESFDPNYKSLPFEEFEPAVNEFFLKKPTFFL